MTTQTPTAARPADPVNREKRPRWLAWATGAFALAIIVVAVVTVVIRNTDSSPAGKLTAARSTPQKATDAYYAAVKAKDATKAFGLICAAQQANGESSFARMVDQDEKTGTGVRSWTRTGPSLVQGDRATVAGTLVLANGTSTPLSVLLTRASDGWRVCSSNLGGILPGPGTSPGA